MLLPQTIVTSSLKANYSHLANGSDTTFGTSSPSHVGAYIRTKLTESALRIMSTSVPNNNNNNNPVPNDLTSQDVTFDFHLWVGDPTKNYQLKKYIRTRSLVQNNKVHACVTPISDSNDIVSYVGANLKPRDDVPVDEECLNIRQDCMTHDICRDSTRYDSTQQIFEEFGGSIIWTWCIGNIATEHV